MSDVRVESFDVNASNNSTHTLTTAVGDVSNAFIKINNNTIRTSAGRTTSQGNLSPADVALGVQLTNTSTLTFSGSTQINKFIGEVWEYTGRAGGANEFLKRGQVAVTLAGGLNTARVSVSGVVSAAKVVPFLNGLECTQSSSGNWHQATLGVRFDTATNEVVVSRRANGTAVTAYISVVEFTGSNWTVASASSNNHDSSRELVTLSADITNWNTAFIEATGEGDTAESGLSDLMFLPYPGTDTDNVYVDYQTGDSDARNDGTAYVYVMRNPDMLVTRAIDNDVQEQDGAYSTDVTFPAGTNTTRDLDQLALEWFVDTSGTGTAFFRGGLGARITDATGTIQHWVHRSGNDVKAAYAVIDLSQLDDPAPPAATGTSVPLQIAPNQVTGTHTNMPLLIVPADTPLGTLTLAQARSIRFYSDENETTELAREVVSASEIHVKVPSVANLTMIYANYDGTRSDYAVTDTYGAQAVWLDYEFVLHGNGYTDSTGNYNPASGGGTITFPQGKLGNSIRTVNGRINLSAVVLSNTVDKTMQFWAKPDSAANIYNTTGRGYFFDVRNDNNRSIYSHGDSGLNPNTPTFWDNTSSSFQTFGTAPTLSTANFNAIHYVHNETTNSMALYVDGNIVGSITTGDIQFASNGSGQHLFAQGVGFSDSDNFHGNLDEIRLRAAQLTADWINTEYNNQNDNASFWQSPPTTGTSYRFIPQINQFGGL
jgi:hypothetical protein